MEGEKKKAIAKVLMEMKEKKMPLHKIVVQKIFYFLDVQGFRLGFRFRPYTYGPYSFDLTDTLDDMVFWGEIGEKHSSYCLKDGIEKHCDLTDKKEEKLLSLLEKFIDIADNDFSFKNMELLGTILYCRESIVFSGKKPTDDLVVKEFKEWKGELYSEEDIRDGFRNLSKIIPVSDN